MKSMIDKFNLNKINEPKQKQRKENIEQIIAITITTVFMGQVYINPFSHWFRFSLAVVILSFLFIYFEKISIIKTSFIIAFFMFIFRAFITALAQDLNLKQALIYYMPVTIFYISYGFLFKFFKIRKKINKPILFILSLWISDSLGNILEGIFRRINLNYEVRNFDKAIMTIIIIGFIRAILTYLIYNIFTNQKKRYDEKKEYSKYKEILFFTSKLKSELFFLKKSKADIEDTMKKTYDLYSKLEDDKLSQEALYISRNIHEIKKDYKRVCSAMEDILSKKISLKKMSFNEIIDIIEENMVKHISNIDKNIRLEITNNVDIIIDEIYPIITILNNLIINSIEAIEESGYVKINSYIESNKLIIDVIDDGIGFFKEDEDLLFEVGYSTKFDKSTGKMSTGLGLSHCKYMLDNYFKGELIPFRKDNKTYFRLKIYLDNLNKTKEKNGDFDE